MFFAVVGCILFMGGVWMLSMAVPDCINELRSGTKLTPRFVSCSMPLIGCFLIAMGLLQIRAYWKRVLILNADAVQVEFVYGLKTLKFNDILGRRTRATRYGHCTVIVPETKRLRKLVIKEGYDVDDFFRTWLASLTDLDAADKEKRREGGNLHFWER